MRYWFNGHVGERVTVLDSLTDAEDRTNLDPINDRPEFRCVHGDIGYTAPVAQLLCEQGLDTAVNCAAETHINHQFRAV